MPSHQFITLKVPANVLPHKFNANLQKTNITKPITSPSPWTKEEVDRLRKFSQQSLPLKEIAFRLDRSTASINKAIDRYKTRFRKKHVKKTDLASPRRRKYTKEKDRPLLQMPITVNIWGMIGWLDTMNLHIQPYKSPGGETLYLLNGRSYSSHHLLIFTNQLRIQEKLPIFHVHNITEF